ncbi:MAG: aldehyde dehydrogenase family protein, partial [Bacteroidota bacterium]|nr:aldehyde dehydrogenase family protein [Bacteroidota bacterium]
MQIINPATEEVIREIKEDSPATLRSKFDILKSAQPRWAQLGIADRVAVLKRFSALLSGQAPELADVLTSEVGKPLQQSRNEIKGAQSRIGWLTDNAEKYLADEVMIAGDGLEEKISYEPLGVVCNISAWNYPYLVGVNVFVPALLAGNAVMYKPSEYATLTGLEIERLLKEAGVPADVFHVAVGGRVTGEALLDLPFQGYFFTGSFKTGQHIYEKVAPKMVPCQCELGGKDPLYVADDVTDVAAVAAATADGAFYNNGQSCCAVERIYVHESIYERYVEAFTREVASWKKGRPTEDGVYFGPLTRRDQVVVLEKQVGDAVAKGAKLIMGGKRDGGTGYFFQPTVLTNVDHTME